MMKQKYWMLIVWICLLVNVVSAKEDFGNYFSRAEELFKAQKYTESIEMYQDMVAKGYENKAIWYNLGNAYYQSGQLGRAVLSYERAVYWGGRDADVVFNLNLVRKSTGQGALQTDKSLWSYVQVLTAWMSFCAWTMLFLFAYLGFFILLILSRFYTKEGICLLKKAFVLLLIVVTPLYMLHVYQRNYVERVVVLEASQNLKNGPGSDFETLRELEWGARAYVTQFSEGWYEVKTEDRLKGWISADVCEVI